MSATVCEHVGMVMQTMAGPPSTEPINWTRYAQFACAECGLKCFRQKTHGRIFHGSWVPWVPKDASEQLLVGAQEKVGGQHVVCVHPNLKNIPNVPQVTAVPAVEAPKPLPAPAISPCVNVPQVTVVPVIETPKPLPVTETKQIPAPPIWPCVSAGSSSSSSSSNSSARAAPKTAESPEVVLEVVAAKAIVAPEVAPKPKPWYVKETAHFQCPDCGLDCVREREVGMFFNGAWSKPE
jgi:predicted RNA-binding Zn-ribbon protein involved in translation (DUF1610 family)